jgi:hypothetical protein
MSCSIPDTTHPSFGVGNTKKIRCLSGIRYSIIRFEPKKFKGTILSEKTDLKDLLKGLLSSQSLAVLATQNGGEPYACLVAFASTDDLKHLIFATTRGTRKYDNLIRNPLASAVIDNRTNREEDFRRAIAATAMGAVEEVKEPDRSHFLGFYLTKHPHLNQFVTSPTSALLRIDVKVYYIVSQFQNVMKFHPDP